MLLLHLEHDGLYHTVVFQVWVVRVHAAKMLVDSKTGQLWKKEQVVPQDQHDPSMTTAAHVDVVAVSAWSVSCIACHHSDCAMLCLLACKLRYATPGSKHSVMLYVPIRTAHCCSSKSKFALLLVTRSAQC